MTRYINVRVNDQTSCTLEAKHRFKINVPNHYSDEEIQKEVEEKILNHLIEYEWEEEE